MSRVGIKDGAGGRPGEPGIKVMAHSPSRTGGVWHALDGHLRGTAGLAREFAAPFGAGEFVGFLAGIHDIGKAGCQWQVGLRRVVCSGGSIGVGHKHAATRLAYERLADMVPFGVLVLLGHHGGLPDWAPTVSLLKAIVRGCDGETVDPDVPAAVEWAMANVPDLCRAPSVPEWVREAARAVQVSARRPAETDTDAQIRLELWLRMCFSALVDADYLDTQAHFEDAPVRRGRATSLGQLLGTFTDARARLLCGRSGGPAGRVREEIYAEVVAQAGLDRGLFRLAAPTGSGKTMTAMGFALGHGAHHGMRRVIVATPFITVTEQNARVYQNLLDPDGNGEVLEHHSSLDDVAAGLQRRDLVANWDAPVVVTTTVQLLESLHANTPSQCRKLHRIAGSVIVIDEVQSLPHHLIPTILHTLRLLVRDYGCSIVLATATQPALWDFHDSPFTGVGVHDLISDPGRVYAQLARVTYRWRRYPSEDGTPAWDAVATDVLDGARLAGGSGLAICSTTTDAANLAVQLKPAVETSGTGTLHHLSTRMTRAHRLRTLAAVRTRLTGGRPVVLVSTQIVEAGVDLDFPFLLRILAPGEALVQAAGRCNREGRRRPLDSTVLVAVVDGAGTPGRLYASAAAIAERWFAPWTSLPGGARELDDPSALGGYFESVYATNRPGTNRRAQALAGSRPALAYQTTDEQFQMIEQVGVNVLVPAADGTTDPLVKAVASGSPLDPTQIRQVINHTATVSRALAAAHARPLSPTLSVWEGPYDDLLGCTGQTPAEDVIW